MNTNIPIDLSYWLEQVDSIDTLCAQAARTCLTGETWWEIEMQAGVGNNKEGGYYYGSGSEIVAMVAMMQAFADAEYQADIERNGIRAAERLEYYYNRVEDNAICQRIEEYQEGVNITDVWDDVVGGLDN